MSTKTIFLLALFSITKVTFPQDQCSDILIPDQSRTISVSEKAATLLNIFKQENIETYQEYKNSKFNATVPIDGVLVGLGYEQNQEGFNDFKNALFRYEFSSSQSKDFLDQTINKLSEASIKAWSDCINRFGFLIWIEQTDDPSTFILAGRFNDDGSGGKPKLRNVSFSSVVTPVGDGFFMYANGNPNLEHEFDQTYQRQLFTRDPKKTLVISISATRGTGFSRSLKSSSNLDYIDDPNKIIVSGSETGVTEKNISINNNKSENVLADVNITFNLKRWSPDNTQSTMQGVYLYIAKGSSWELLEKSGQIAWIEDLKKVKLDYQLRLPANSSVRLKAHLGLWDRFDLPRSSIQWEIKY